MKQISYFILLAGMTILFSLSSCRKEKLPAVPNTGSQTRPVFVTELRADTWSQDVNGLYFHTFTDVIYQGASLKVFLLSPGREEQITRYITFMNGQLWATARGSDLTLYYRSSGPLPFGSLTIRIEVE